MRPRALAVVLAAGKGERTGADIAKQYIHGPWGVPLCESVKSLIACPEVGQVLCVIRQEDTAKYDEMMAHLNSSCKLLKPVFGGKTRFDSVLAGTMEAAKHDPEIVLIHDAARGRCDISIVQELMAKIANKTIAAIPVCQPRDSLIVHAKVIANSEALAIATPQAYETKALMAEIERRAAENIRGDSILARDMKNVALVKTDGAPIKVTYQQDIGRIRVGFGYDEHQANSKHQSGKIMRLMGVDVEGQPQLESWSDGDAGLHSISDAILGAAGLGSLGEHFPDGTAETRDLDSREIVRKCSELALRQGTNISSIDATIICKSPVITEYAERMRRQVAELVGIDVQSVNIKGKRGCDDAGNSTKVAVYAVVTAYT